MPRILFVDDEPQIAKALSRLFRRQGYEVEIAATGEEALGKLEAFRPDIVVSDFRMPGMNGAELLTQVRRRCPLTARLILSGCADLERLVHRGGWDPGCDIAHKPWDDSALVSHVARLLHPPHVGASPRV